MSGAWRRNMQALEQTHGQQAARRRQSGTQPRRQSRTPRTGITAVNATPDRAQGARTGIGALGRPESRVHPDTLGLPIHRELPAVAAGSLGIPGSLSAMKTTPQAREEAPPPPIPSDSEESDSGSDSEADIAPPPQDMADSSGVSPHTTPARLDRDDFQDMPLHMDPAESETDPLAHLESPKHVSTKLHDVTAPVDPPAADQAPAAQDSVEDAASPVSAAETSQSSTVVPLLRALAAHDRLLLGLKEASDRIDTAADLAMQLYRHQGLEALRKGLKRIRSHAMSDSGDREALQQIAAAAEARAADRSFLQLAMRTVQHHPESDSYRPDLSAGSATAAIAGSGSNGYASSPGGDDGGGYARKHRSSLLVAAAAVSSPTSRNRGTPPPSLSAHHLSVPMQSGAISKTSASPSRRIAKLQPTASIDAEVEARIEVLLGSRPLDLSRHSAGALLASHWAKREDEGHGDDKSRKMRTRTTTMRRTVMPVSPTHSAATSPRFSNGGGDAADGGATGSVTDSISVPGQGDIVRNKTPTSPRTSSGRRPSIASELPAKLSSASPRRLHREAGWAAEQYRKQSVAGSISHLMTDSGHESGSERSGVAPAQQSERSGALPAKHRQATTRRGNRRVRSKRPSGGLASQPRAGWASSLRD